jgi:hypothetical protein
MEDGVGVERERLADVVLEQRRGRVEVLALAGGEVVDDRDLVAACQQRIHEVGSDEACTPRDDRAHRVRRLGGGCS